MLGIAKGAGMIHPQLATMLVYLFTDVGASARELQPLLREACDDSLNCMSIDGDTSTNDTVLLLASGASGARVRDVRTRKKFSAALTGVCQSLAEQIVSDGEGVQHVIRLFVEQARQQGRGVAGGADDCSLHAREDRVGWCRSELGTHSRGSGKVRRAHRPVARADFYWQSESMPQRRRRARSTNGKPTAVSRSRSAMFACSLGAASTRCDFSPPT